MNSTKNGKIATPTMLTIKDLMARWNASRSSIYAMRANGLLQPPCHPTGSRMARWPLPVIEAFELAQQG